MTTLTDFLLARTAGQCGCTTTGKIVRGMCATHYDRWVHATPRELRGPAPRTIRQFWDHVDKSQDCWEWTGPKNARGYGTWSEPGFRGLAHRFSLLQEVTPDSLQQFACHHCDNPGCVRPSHLYWGDVRTNMRDRVERQGIHNEGVYSTRCPQGHPMSGDNLRVSGKDSKRACRACDNERARLRMAKPVTCTTCGREMPKSSLTRHQKRADHV